jgi:hypothetical protein
MSLFVCSKCGCIDNTATSYYWALIRPCKNRIYDKSLKGYEGKPLCSECAAIEYSKGDEVVVVPGTWHGKFKKEWPTEEEKKHIGKNGILNMQIMCDKEIVVCAAIWVQDHKNKPHGPVNIPSGTVFCGLRHCSIISQLAAYGIAHKNRSVQGFLTSKNRFLTREEASELVKSNNQEMVVDRSAIREQLYSEDLY